MFRRQPSPLGEGWSEGPGCVADTSAELFFEDTPPALWAYPSPRGDGCCHTQHDKQCYGPCSFNHKSILMLILGIHIIELLFTYSMILFLVFDMKDADYVAVTHGDYQVVVDKD